MGAGSSVLEGCRWGEEVADSSLDWDLQHAETKDGCSVTVFQPKKYERKYDVMLRSLAQSLKTLRHPNILRFVDVGQTSECCQLVTEQVVPLSSVIDKLSAQEICAGLYDVMDAIVFLHDKVGISHNNVCLKAIFVAKDGGWRLGELQHACPFAAATPEYLDTCRAFRDQTSLSPEEKQGKVVVKDGQGHTRDVYALAVVMDQLQDSLCELGEFTKTFEQRVATCRSEDPSLRPSVLTLRNDRLFQNDFALILSFLKNVALKTTEEKAEFFSGLLPRLLALPEDLVGKRLSVPLLSRFVLLDSRAVSDVVPHLLTPKSGAAPLQSRTAPAVTPLLSEAAFRTHVTPELQRILHVHDAHIRLVLLRHFSQYARLFHADALRDEIFPQILLGLRDTDDAIVAASLRALADLVPLLGGDTVIGGQRKTFFFHGIPKFPAPGQYQESGEEKSPSTVTDIMQPLKSAVNGKPLLKDLASLARKAVSDPEKEKKKALERERRKEEARLRREERQRRLKQEAQQPDTEEATDALKRESVSAADASPVERTDKDIVPDDREERQSGDDDDDDGDDDKDHHTDGIKKLLISAPENRENSQDEWSDWDDTEADSAYKSRDDVMEDEIEVELARMSGGKITTNKVQTSPDPYRTGSPALLQDWGRSESAVISDSSPPYHGRVTEENADEKGVVGDLKATLTLSDGRTDVSDSSKPSLGKGLKLTAKNKTRAPAGRGAPPKKPGVAGDLGFGYDIKSIELTAVKQEVDFFADMTPDIKTKDLESALSVTTRTSHSDTDITVDAAPLSSHRFAVAVEQTEEDAGGWGEDADWGTDSF